MYLLPPSRLQLDCKDQRCRPYRLWAICCRLSISVCRNALKSASIHCSLYYTHITVRPLPIVAVHGVQSKRSPCPPPNFCDSKPPLAATASFNCQILKIYISPERIYPVAKRMENNQSTNLTININSQHIHHDEVGNTWNYTEQNNLWLYSVIL